MCAVGTWYIILMTHFNIITLHYEETEVDKQLGEGILSYGEGLFSQVTL